MSKICKAALILFVSFHFISAASWAQTGGTLKGTVVDSNGKFGLPTVRVSVARTKKFAASQADGAFVIENIPAGTYTVSFELAGYITNSKKDVKIMAGETTELAVALYSGYSHELTVTARRGEAETLQKVPQNIEVLTSTELAETPMVTLGQALNNVIGVDIETGSGNASWGAFMYVDGFDDVYIKKMVDGVDVGEIIGNWSQINIYPTELLEQVEVMKGGTSSVWGSNMGGVINLVTKRPRDMERPQITLKGMFSKFGKMEWGNQASVFPNSGNLFDYSGNIIGTLNKFYYMFGYNRHDFDGFVEYGPEKNYNIFSKLGYTFNDKTYLDFLYSGNRVTYKNHAFLKGEGIVDPYPYVWNYKQDQNSWQHMASLKFSTLAAPALNLEAQLKFYHFDVDWTQNYLNDTPPWELPAGTITTGKSVERRLGFTVKGSYNPSTAFSLVSGVDYYRIKADFTKQIANQPVIYVDTVAPFANMVYRLGPVAINAGARYDYDSSFGNQLSPSLGFNVNILKSTILRATVARTFKVPDLWITIGESYADLILPNPNLKPERAWAYSAGFETQEVRFLWLKFSLYRSDMTDGIVVVPSEESPGRLTWANVTKFRKQGYEAEVGFITPFGLSGYVAQNHNDHKNITGGSIISWIPTRVRKVGLKYKNEKLDLMANLRGRWVFWNETEDLITYFHPKDKEWIVDLIITKGFSLSPTTHVGVSLNVFNLLNKIAWDRSDSPNPKRWVALSFEVSFK
jgi:vitamin B12 transporter